MQPDATLAVVPGRYLQTVGGFVLSQAKLQEIYDSLTRDLAVALQDPGVRSMVYHQLHASPYPQHKVHFRTFLINDGRALLEAIAEHRHVLPQVVLATLDSLVDFEFYMPVKDHWHAWVGGADLLAANDLSDDDDVLPAVFDLGGDAVPIKSEYDPPATPTLSLVPVETDFSKPVSTAGPERAAMDAGPGLYMTSSHIEDLKEPFTEWGPEIEVHAFVRNAAGNYVDLQCAGEEQSDPFRFNQDDHDWSGPEVEIIPEDAIGTNPIDVVVWENDGTYCQPSTGRPPAVDQYEQGRWNAWGVRPTVTVSLAGGVKVVSWDNLGIPLVLEIVAPHYNTDDPVGEARVPSCWPSSSGSASFTLYLSESGHPSNGWVNLDYRFGQRDPICPPPPLSVQIDGPGSGDPFQQVTLTAVVSNGTAPFSYAWTKDGSPVCGNESTCSETIGAEGTTTMFAVTVTDAQQATAYDEHPVYAYCQTSPCTERPQRLKTTGHARPDKRSTR